MPFTLVKKCFSYLPSGSTFIFLLHVRIANLIAWKSACPTRHTCTVNKAASYISPLLYCSVSCLLWKDNHKELEYKSFLMSIQSLVYLLSLLSRVPISVTCNGGFCTTNILQLGIGLKDHHLISHWKPKQSSYSNNFWSLLTQTSSNQ